MMGNGARFPETARLQSHSPHQPARIVRAVSGSWVHTVKRSVHVFDPDGTCVELYCDMVSNGFKALQTLGPASKPLGIETGAVGSRSPKGVKVIVSC